MRELLEAWIESRLDEEIEQEFLELADDVCSDGCGAPRMRPRGALARWRALAKDGHAAIL